MRHLLITAAMAISVLAACGGASDADSTGSAPPTDATTTDSTVVEPAPSTAGDVAASTDVVTTTEEIASDAAPDTVAEPVAPVAVPFEASFERCLTSAGIAWTDEIRSILAPPAGVLLPDIVTAPADPVASYGPPGEAWWGVLVAEHPQDRYFLSQQMPTATSYAQWGRVISLRGAITQWSGDDMFTVADLPAEQQAQLAPISACVLAALDADEAARAATAVATDTTQLNGALTGLDCDGPDCQIVANEATFTVPADGSAGQMSGVATYSVAVPSTEGPPGCSLTITRTFTYEGTVDETPKGTSVSSSRIGFREAFSSGATTATDPAWPGRVLATGTFDLDRMATPTGCDDDSTLTDLPATFIGYYAPEVQVLSGSWTQGPAGPSYLWAMGEM